MQMLAVMPNMGVGFESDSGSYALSHSATLHPMSAAKPDLPDAAAAATGPERDLELACLLVLSAVEDVLGEQVGMEDNLIDMGMHSVQVGLYAWFDRPTQACIIYHLCLACYPQ